MGNIDKCLNWFVVRVGNVDYSMTKRNGPQSYDCSSAVFSALIEGNFLPKGTQLGNTETLFGLVGALLQPISEQEIRRGDLFIQGVPGQSLGASGHTGFALNQQELIHCCDYYHGIAITPMQGWTRGVNRSTHWYRLVDVKTQHHTVQVPDQGFIPLMIGQPVTIRTGMTQWETGEQPYTDMAGIRDTIIESKEVIKACSKRAYLLKELYSWILEQDLVEAWPKREIIHEIKKPLPEDHRLVIAGQTYELVKKS